MGIDTQQKPAASSERHPQQGQPHLPHPLHQADSMQTKESIEKLNPFHNCLLDNFQQHQERVRRYDNEIAAIQFAHDIQIHADSQFHNSGEAMHSRSQLEDVARKKLSIPQMKSFEQDIVAFEKRAAGDHLSPEKVTGFYDHTARLLKEKALHYSPTQKTNMALELVHHAANPESVTQGFAQTCNVSSVEYRMLSKDPQAVAKMTADVAANGTFTTAEGNRLLDNWHSIKPDANDSGRDMLDKLVQSTLVNCHWERFKRFDEDSTYFRFEHSKDLMGDRIFQYDANGAREPMRDEKTGLPVNDPQLSSAQLREIYNQAAGTNDAAFAIANANPKRQTDRTPFTSDDDCTYVNSAHALHETLLQGSREGRFPMELQVHTANNPFLKQTLKNDPTAPLDDAHFNWHAISIKSYNAQTHTVKIHNSWGKENDVNINLDELYRATMRPPGWKSATDD